METKLFEYHCYEGHDSQDAQLWYRSHQKVVVGECQNSEYLEMTLKEREEAAMPLVYAITFSDGFTGHAWEDELLDSKSEYYCDDPPPAREEVTP